MSTILERAWRNVSLSEFENNVEPLEVSTNFLTCPYEEQHILRMCVCSNGENYRIPEELEWVKPLWREAYKHQYHVIDMIKCFCYITVRHGIVKSVTDDEWHVDGFSTKIRHKPEQNYIWTNSIPTEYTNVSVKFPDDFDPLKHNVNHFLQNHITEEVKQCKDHVLYCLDPYILHRRPSISTGTKRTFVRISFVPIMIDDVNNTQNPLLPQTYTNDGVAFREKLSTY